ncbi:MAG: DUF1580 domain-containing protein [Dehalococcoidia bacterium]
MTTATLDAPAPIDLDTAEIRPVAQLAADLTGRRPSPATIWRWCRRGTRRAGRLPAVVAFGTWHTTAEAYRAWIQRGSEPTPPQDDAAAERSPATERRLRKAGLLR